MKSEVTARPIGIFDSGMGGLSVLRELMAIMPCEDYIYYGDNKNAPYGVKGEAEILRLTRSAIDLLYESNIKALVIACNTATSAAAAALRAEAIIPIVGMEPALKSAALSGLDGAILVMATPLTLYQEKFGLLMSKYGQNAIPVPCKGLMEFVERGDRDSAALNDYLHALFEPYRNVKLAGVVLGCTHYIFIKDAIARALPGVPQFDGNAGTARRLKSLLEERGALRMEGEGGATLMTSGDTRTVLPLMKALLYE